MDNHLHVLVRLDSQRVADWPDRDVARRWLTLFPIRDVAGKEVRTEPVQTGISGAFDRQNFDQRIFVVGSSRRRIKECQRLRIHPLPQ